jgi:hypothetical protein
MKRTIFITIIVLMGINNITAQTSSFKKDPIGKWIFEAPYAPQGYTNGVVEISKKEKLFYATMAFGGAENKFTGDRFKFENDTISFHVYIENQDVSLTFTFLNESKMAGKAVYTEGVVPFSMSREIKKN